MNQCFNGNVGRKPRENSMPEEKVRPLPPMTLKSNLLPFTSFSVKNEPFFGKSLTYTPKKFLALSIEEKWRKLVEKGLCAKEVCRELRKVFQTWNLIITASVAFASRLRSAWCKLILTEVLLYCVLFHPLYFDCLYHTQISEMLPNITKNLVLLWCRLQKNFVKPFFKPCWQFQRKTSTFVAKKTFARSEKKLLTTPKGYVVYRMAPLRKRQKLLLTWVKKLLRDDISATRPLLEMVHARQISFIFHQRSFSYF